MRVTAKVLSNNKIVGYMINNAFVSRESIYDYKGKLKGVNILRNGLIVSKYKIKRIKLSEIKGSNNTKNSESIKNKVYRNNVVKNKHIGFSRDITLELDNWFKYDKDLVLFIKGARQVGKTYEIRRFAKAHFEYEVYINLSIDKAFIEKIIKRGKIGLLELIQKYCRERNIKFKNDESTILIIDEIQISLEVFNLIRALKNELKCCVAVTGSYLGFVVNRKSFYAAGDLYPVEMTSMTFKEFCKANGGEYKKCDKTKDLYNVYRQIGGFPGVVAEYVKNKDLNRCMSKIESLWGIFCQESDAYILDTPCENVFNDCMNRVVMQMMSEKTGFSKLLNNEEESIKVMTNDAGDMPLITNKVLKKSYTWLNRSGILGICQMHKDGKVRNSATDLRYYICDLGLANYLIRKNGQLPSVREGALTECFVYNELKNSAKGEIASGVPHCSVYQGYELDFIFVNKAGDRVIGIEAKTTNTEAKSLKLFKKSGLIDIAIKAGMFEYQVNSNGLVNYPIYMIGALSVDRIIEDIISNKE